MKLHDAGRAPNPRRVQIFMKEKGIEIERIQYDLNAHDQKSEAFKRLNPMQGLPVLELDDGTTISETVAICRYLEEIYPDPPLMGRTPLEKAVIEMWQRRIELYFLMPVAQAFRHLHPGAKAIEPDQITAWGELNKPRAMRFMDIFNGHLQENAFVAGDEFSIADITGLVTCQFLKPARLAIADEHTALKAWFEKVAARSSAAFDT